MIVCTGNNWSIPCEDSLRDTDGPNVGGWLPCRLRSTVVFVYGCFSWWGWRIRGRCQWLLITKSHVPFLHCAFWCMNTHLGTYTPSYSNRMSCRWRCTNTIWWVDIHFSWMLPSAHTSKKIWQVGTAVTPSDACRIHTNLHTLERQVDPWGFAPLEWRWKFLTGHFSATPEISSQAQLLAACYIFYWSLYTDKTLIGRRFFLILQNLLSVHQISAILVSRNQNASKVWIYCLKILKIWWYKCF